MRLRFAGEVLDDETCILADYGVQRDSTLFLDRAVRVSVKDTYGGEIVGEGRGEGERGGRIPCPFTFHTHFFFRRLIESFKPQL